jgi:hypothetical protein
MVVPPYLATTKVKDSARLTVFSGKFRNTKKIIPLEMKTLKKVCGKILRSCFPPSTFASQ